MGNTMQGRGLLILDINGLLCRKVEKDYLGSVDLELASYKVILRPGCGEFLEKCYSKYNVAFFSSTTWRNAGAILDLILSKAQKKQTKFQWYRDRTTLDPDWGVSEITTYHPSWSFLPREELQSYSTVKLLSSVWSNPIVNVERQYSSKNTLICDDSPLKLRLNSQKNCICIAPFTKTEEETLADLWNNIRAKFSQL